nr:hypothetical protein [uncultured Cohaesibacter sp.]
MFHFKTASLCALLLMASLAGCRTVPIGMDEMDDMLGQTPDIKGEVQWNFAATSGDLVLVGLQDAAGVIKSAKVIPPPGAKHVDFSLSISKSDRTKCLSRGSCRYSAELREGQTLKARGFIYFTTTLNPIIEISQEGTIPQTVSASAPNQPQTSGGAPVQKQQLPKPVYR